MSVWQNRRLASHPQLPLIIENQKKENCTTPNTPTFACLSSMCVCLFRALKMKTRSPQNRKLKRWQNCWQKKATEKLQVEYFWLFAIVWFVTMITFAVFRCYCDLSYVCEVKLSLNPLDISEGKEHGEELLKIWFSSWRRNDENLFLSFIEDLCCFLGRGWKSWGEESQGSSGWRREESQGSSGWRE
jgi:hypothetical protein